MTRDAQINLANNLACRFTAAYVGQDSLTQLMTLSRVQLEGLWTPFAYALAELVTDSFIKHDDSDPQEVVESLQARALAWEWRGGASRSPREDQP